MGDVDLDALLADAERAWPHNAHLIDDARVEDAVRRGMTGQRTCDEYLAEMDGDSSMKAMLRLGYAKSEYVATDFLEALHSATLPQMSEPCDRCHAPVQPTARLWMPAGATVVEVQVCLDCRGYMDRYFGPVIWR